jgi:hypothetical protein
MQTRRSALLLLAAPVFGGAPYVSPATIKDALAEARAHPDRMYSDRNLRIGPASIQLEQQICGSQGVALSAPGTTTQRTGCSGSCQRCKTTWRFVEWHTTPYGTGHGCLALCKLCWRDLTPQTRLPFYREWWMNSTPRVEAEWADIRSAVLEGK